MGRITEGYSLWSVIVDHNFLGRRSSLIDILWHFYIAPGTKPTCCTCWHAYLAIGTIENIYINIYWYKLQASSSTFSNRLKLFSLSKWCWQYQPHKLARPVMLNMLAIEISSSSFSSTGRVLSVICLWLSIVRITWDLHVPARDATAQLCWGWDRIYSDWERCDSSISVPNVYKHAHKEGKAIPSTLCVSILIHYYGSIQYVEIHHYGSIQYVENTPFYGHGSIAVGQSPYRCYVLRQTANAHPNFDPIYIGN